MATHPASEDHRSRNTNDSNPPHGRPEQRRQKRKQGSQPDGDSDRDGATARPHERTRKAEHHGGHEESNLRHALTLKRDQVFLLTTQTGDIHQHDPGYGVFFHDMCYLDQLELLIGGQPLVPLLADAGADDAAVYELTNGQLTLAEGDTIEQSRISVRRLYHIAEDITQEVEIRNLDRDPHTLDVDFRLSASFTDMLVLRGFLKGPIERGDLREPDAQGHTLTFRYDGADKHIRTTRVTFTAAGAHLDPTGATYRLKLKSGERKRITMRIELEDVDATHGSHRKGPNDTPHTHERARAQFEQTLSGRPVIETNLPRFDEALTRALDDLRMLATSHGSDVYVAAGAPWYVALFGRDSCIAAFETLAYYPRLASATLDILARYQGTRYDEWRDEQPGKILHEFRVGEAAHLNEVPMTPYYGTVDATPWFLILLHAYVQWTGDMALFERLRHNVERAIDWMKSNCSEPIKGYLSYGTRSEGGLINQGWKDSSNGVVNADGSLVQPPVALVEVQGYAYRAYRATADLYRLAHAHGDDHRADQLEQAAADLMERFNHDFWMHDEGYYAFALERNGVKAEAIASNPGQALFTGIVTPERAQAVAQRLMADDMFAGWGIRTLSANAVAYNPLDYQVGSVWPHDNALIALGLKRCGFASEMERVFTGIFDAANTFPQLRLPELFDGFSRERYAKPVPYPQACSPQAWAAGALPLMLQEALGLDPCAPRHMLSIRQPHLPAWLDKLELRGLRVGESEVDLSYRRDGDTTLVAVPRHTGDLDIAVEY